MAVWAEMLGDGTIGRQEALGVAGRFEPLHPLLPLPSGLVRVLCPVVEIPMLPMFRAGEEFALSCCVALEFVGDDHSGHVG
jgi:hypothetical protein